MTFCLGFALFVVGYFWTEALDMENYFHPNRMYATAAASAGTLLMIGGAVQLVWEHFA